MTSSNRRSFLTTGMGAIVGAVSAASASTVAMAALPEPVIQTTPDTASLQCIDRKCRAPWGAPLVVL